MSEGREKVGGIFRHNSLISASEILTHATQLEHESAKDCVDS
jgi:hypothetical protein